MTTERDWIEAKEWFPIGKIVSADVIRVEAFGVFLDLPDANVRGLLLVPFLEDGERALELEDYPRVGDSVRAIVVHHEEHNRQIRLSMRASDFVRFLGDG